VIDSAAVVREVHATPEVLEALAKATYNLGIFVFTKTKTSGAE
jgi:hypothetical protein